MGMVTLMVVSHLIAAFQLADSILGGIVWLRGIIWLRVQISSSISLVRGVLRKNCICLGLEVKVIPKITILKYQHTCHNVNIKNATTMYIVLKQKSTTCDRSGCDNGCEAKGWLIADIPPWVRGP